jgi:hypothetical protein
MDMQIDTCIKKYMETVKIVQKIQHAELANSKTLLEQLREDDEAPSSNGADDFETT